MKKYFFERQDDLKDCGVSCLMMIIKSYGGNASKEYLRWLTNTNKSGTTFYNILMASKKFNFSSVGFKSEVKNLDKVKLPLIAHVIIDESYKHFVVVYEIDFKNNKLLVADPADKIKWISFIDFENISTGNFLELTPYKKVPNLNNKDSMRELLKQYLKNNKRNILSIMLLSLFVVLLTCLISYFITLFLNIMNINIKFNLYLVIIAMLSVILFKTFLNYTKYLMILKFNKKIDSSIFQNVFDKIISLPYIYFKNRTTGEVLSRINDLHDLREFLSKVVTTSLVDILLFITSFLLLLFIDIKFLIVIIILIFIYLVLFMFYRNKISDYNLNLKENGGEVNSYLTEVITSIETIRNLNINYVFSNLLKKKYDKYMNSYTSFNKKLFKLNIYFEIIDGLLLIYVILYKYISYINGNIYLNDIVLISNLFTFVSSSLLSILLTSLDYVMTYNSIKRIKEIIDIYDYDNNKDDGKDIEIKSIKTNNLSYSYNYNNYALDNLNIDIKMKDKIMIKGKSGIGKSTFAKILMGYLNVTDGQVFINDDDINNIDKDILKKRITYISQNEDLFSMSVKDNIVMRRDIEDNEFNNIVKLTKVNDIFDNYNYVIEEGGFNISGGQRQRIVLSRSLLKKSDVYILDESLCNLDVSLEREILINILDYLKDKIVIYISHRYNNEDLFNKVITF